jgi:hypothetical protein
MKCSLPCAPEEIRYVTTTAHFADHANFPTKGSCEEPDEHNVPTR